MSLLTTFKLPDVGEGLTEAEVVTWHVTVGDRIEVNEPLVDIETAKCSRDAPCRGGNDGARGLRPGQPARGRQRR
jgi:2-oxoisovalerate dehydrogenase E2 component (dihydrolipoyl transacylase)